MPGPKPKPGSARTRTRQRAAKQLAAAPVARVWPLPRGVTEGDGEPRKWHRETRAEWKAWMSSAMAAEFIESDVAALRRLIVIVDDCWKASSLGERLRAEKELRLAGERFGFDPTARLGLRWSVVKTEGAERAAAAAPGPKPAVAHDPKLRLLEQL